MHGSAHEGDLKTLWVMSRSETRTTNLMWSEALAIMLSESDQDAYLWKIDTQLRGPLAHCARYESNFG
jgi:hypothetical protein